MITTGIIIIIIIILILLQNFPNQQTAVSQTVAVKLLQSRYIISLAITIIIIAIIMNRKGDLTAVSLRSEGSK